ncbi:MAG: hypothetical protein QM820_10335 [Minicystis sp.]
MRTEQDGWDGARSEIVNNQEKLGDRAGITEGDFNRFVALDGQYGQILAALPRVQKAVEVVRESLAHVDNQRHKLVTQFANSAERHVSAEGGNPTLSTAYEKTIAYRSVIADKAVKTRKKNEEAKKAAASTPAPVAPAATVTPAPAAEKVTESVSRIPAPPPEIIFAIDLLPLKGFLVDLPPGAMRGMRHEQDGWEDAEQEIVNNQPKYGDRAGITNGDFTRFVALNDQFDQLEPQLPVLEKAEEILLESLAYVDDQRHKLVTQFAESAEDHASAEGDHPALLTAYEKTIAYRAVIAEKAAKTRKKNEEAKKAAAPAPNEPANG